MNSNWSCSPETPNSGQYWQYFSVWPWNLMANIGKQLDTSSILHQALCIISNPSVKWNLSYSPETLKSGQNWWFFVPGDLKVWWMTLKNNRSPLMYYIKLCASFQSHGWIQSGATVRNFSIRVEIVNFLSRVTLKFDGWPWKTIGHLSYDASSFVNHFITVGEFKLELQSRIVLSARVSSPFRLKGEPP